MIYWLAQDGYDYPFQADHCKHLDDLVEGLAEWADFNPEQKSTVQYKAFEPRTHIMLPTIALCCRYGELFHTHWNDNWKLFDDNIIVGTVNLGETLEALFWLDEWGYEGWFGLDLFPYREDPAKTVEETIANLKFGYELLDRVPRDELRKCFQTSDAIRISQLMQRMLGGR